MNLSLGGPGVACSAMKLRRLAAGELPAEEARRVAEHLAGCDRCQAQQREQDAERHALHLALPFDRFAAGVAERLAPADGKPARRRAAAFVPLALAAGLAVAAIGPAAWRGLAGTHDEGTRLKGGASASLYVKDASGVRALDGAVPAGALLQLTLAPAGHRYTGVALLDEDGVALVHVGEAGAVPAFEWTGKGRGLVVVVFDDAPIDAAALKQRLVRTGPASACAPGHPGCEVSFLRLAR